MAKAMEDALAETGLMYAELRFKWSAIALTLLSVLMENGLKKAVISRLSEEQKTLIEKDAPGILTNP